MSGSRDLYSSFGEGFGLITASATGANNATGIEVKDFYGFAAIALLGASGAGTVKLQESDTLGSGYTDCVAEDVRGTQGEDLVQSQAVRLGYIGCKKFFRMVVTMTVTGDIAVAYDKGYAQISR